MIPVHTFADRTVAVFGLARSGGATVRALVAGRARVVAWDDRADRLQEYAGAGVEIGNLHSFDFNRVDALVLSPGVPLTHPAPHPIVARARAANKEVIGDIELFVRSRPRARTVGVTGTNGKSTTTALVAHILEGCGRVVELGGNIGRPVLDLAPLEADGFYVLEVSSYQIDLAPSLSCDVAVLINISPDHLDRHGSMAGYVAVKARLLTNQHRGQAAVIGVDDPHCRSLYDQLARDPNRTIIPISVGHRVPAGVSVVEGVLVDATEPDETTLDLRQARALRGSHNWQNAAAAFAAVRALGLRGPEIAKVLPTFPGLAHRLEEVAQVGPVTFVNDSKATNADAASKALAAFDRIYWIAGGRAKEGGIESLRPLFGRIRHTFLIGEAADSFATTLSPRVPTTRSATLDCAVADAGRLALAEGGGVVLLSPACASFDQFRDFEARGEAFRRLALAFPGAVPTRVGS
ncbi:MAG: UDP-N-acetylmuramoyl-L-alanine--D-glutamate ligase [Alphaproteobacteria bacterium]|nr:UDP-N-acetylmuramoyl-L-alanine--D-glutamate ligase [Alphaproteobacteria bacterium]